MGQELGQVPQWLGLDVRSTHPSRGEQSTRVSAQAHVPLLHTAPGAHAWGQVPQWWGSFMASTHPTPVPQYVDAEVGQVHVPAMHEEPGPHWLPHCPQLLLSAVVSVHAPEQTVGAVTGHAWHTPEMQRAPVGQAWLEP